MATPPEQLKSTPLPGAHFATTRWSVVLAARDKASPASEDALQILCRAYWPPLYAFIRRLGNPPHDAEDLTQEFFARLLHKGWLEAVDQERGKFRTFLIMAVKRFLANEWDKTRAARRGGGQTALSLDTQLAEELYLADESATLSAELLFERRWALTLLEQAMARLRSEYEGDGRRDDFNRLKEYLTAERGGIPYGEIARVLETSEGAARVAVHRLRKRFRDVFRTTVADTVSGSEDVDAEMRFVIEVLSRV
jgi:RNA polymerase sigma-70 factor (ECF subfamily)